MSTGSFRSMCGLSPRIHSVEPAAMTTPPLLPTRYSTSIPLPLPAFRKLSGDWSPYRTSANARNVPGSVVDNGHKALCPLSTAAVRAAVRAAVAATADIAPMLAFWRGGWWECPLLLWNHSLVVMVAMAMKSWIEVRSLVPTREGQSFTNHCIDVWLCSKLLSHNADASPRCSSVQRVACNDD